MFLRHSWVAYIACSVAIWSGDSQIGMSQTPVTLTGHITLPNGSPAEGMHVLAVPYGSGFSGKLMTGTTDKEGFYRVQSPHFESVRLIIFNEDAGYPNTVGILFTSPNDHITIVQFAPEQSSAEVNLKLATPDGVLTGTVRDSRSGAVVPQARITMKWADDVDVIYSSYLKPDGSFTYALPPRPMLVEFSAPGYKTWRFVDKKTGGASLTMQPMDKSVIDVMLDPQ